ncbi:hypothetical protein SEA_BEEGEE_74 [Gordonia phage BeeGee]|nr:hypothetical protein SEA_BEEGEE_74 [Gordonia phage BeeGee]
MRAMPSRRQTDIEGGFMRIRATKPEFWRSKTIATLDWDTRLVLKALESYVDDNGVGKDSVVIFCADAFPHDLANSPEICAKVSRSLSRLSEAGLIARYNVDGEDLVYVRNWKKWQYIDKPKAGRYPRPDGTMNYREPVDETIGAGQGVSESKNREESPEPRENFAKSARKVPEECPQIQSGEQGNRGSEEQGSPPALPELSHQGGGGLSPRRETRASKRIADLNATSRSGTANQFAVQFAEWAGGNIPRQTLIEIAQEVDILIADGIDAHQIAEGVKAWHRSDRVYASQIPHFVAKAAKPVEDAAKPTKATLRAVDTLAATERLIAEFRETA